MKKFKHKKLAIVGPTASGKSELALRLAKKLNGSIICADSRTIYKGMDIGTAKPTKLEQLAIDHYCIDLVNPNEKFSVIMFKEKAIEAIDLSLANSKLPILVGGSGLYLDSVIYDYKFPEIINDSFESMGLKELQDLCELKGYSVSEQVFKNKRHLVSFMRRNGETGKKEFNSDFLVVGIKPSKEVTHKRIELRVSNMIKNGFINEVKDLVGKFPYNSTGFNAPGYKPFIDYLDNKITIDEAIENFIRNDKSLAKRQMTWFKRNKNIVWFDNINDAESYIIEQ